MNNSYEKAIYNPENSSTTPSPQSSPTRAFKPKARNGKVAHLPKLERDLVNHMLADAIPHATIAAALANRGFKLTARNISNWVTRGGYREWRDEQALALETRLQQDNLTDFLHDDPTRLPEVGLQIMATRYSQLILRSNLDPQQSFPLVATLCRISNEMVKLHKFRDRRCSLGNPGYQFERQKKEDTKAVETIRKVYSGEPVQDEPAPRKPTFGEFLDALRSAAAQQPSTAVKSHAPPPPPAAKPAPSTPATPPAAPAPKPLENQKSKPKTPQPSTHGSSSQIENQKSKIKNLPSPSLQHFNTPLPQSSPTPPPQTSAATTSPPQSAAPVENQNSKIENLPVPSIHQSTNPPIQSSSTPPPQSPAPVETQNPKIETTQPSAPSAGPSSPIETQKSKIENVPSPSLQHSTTPAPQSSPPPSVVEITPLHTPLRFIDNVPQPPPPQQCPKCHIPLAPYWLDGGAPEPICSKCGTSLHNLYGDAVERCPACSHPLPPLLPNGLRPRRVCAVCGCGLPTPKTPGPHPAPLQINARFCMYCRHPIPWRSEGSRPSNHCTKCHRRLPRAVYFTGLPVSPYPGSEEFTSP